MIILIMNMNIMIFIMQGRRPAARRMPVGSQGSGGITWLTLLVQHMFSSKVANNVADCNDP